MFKLGRFWFLAAGVVAVHSFAQAQDPQIEFFPAMKLFPRFNADGLAHQFSLNRITDNREWMGAIGGEFRLVQLECADYEVQVGVAATVFNRLTKTPGHITVSTIDYKIDFPIDVRIGQLAVRGFFGHISAHYADDGIEQLGKKSISSVRDYLALAGSYDFSNQVFGYLQTYYNFHNEPVTDKQWHLQVGGQFGNVSLSKFISFYSAIDLKVKEDVSWGSTQSYHVGLKMFAKDPYALRLAYTHRRGYEDRGQVYDQRETTNLISLFIDF